MRKKAFTLIELLVVIAIVAVLISILMPALGKARKHAKAVKCLAHMRQLGVVSYMYAQANDEVIPRGIDSNQIWFLLYLPYLGENKATIEDDYRSVKIYRCPDFPLDGVGLADADYPDGTPNELQTVTYVVNAWGEFDGDQVDGPTPLYEMGKPATTIYLADNEAGEWRPVIRDRQQLGGTAYSRLDVFSSSHLADAPDRLSLDPKNTGDNSGRRVAASRHFNGSNRLYLDGHAGYLDTFEESTRFWEPLH